MAALALLLRVLLVLLLVRLVLRFVAGVVRGMQAPAPSPRGAAQLVRDPSCGTFVAPERAVPGRFEGQAALFCSTGCRDRAAVLPGSR